MAGASALTTGLGNSPYSAISAFAGNPLLISLERLADRGWLEKEESQEPLFRPDPNRF